ncbi:MAG: NAD(P)/FAD-dependent oxidoreductase [Burkholderiales bacterium]
MPVVSPPQRIQGKQNADWVVVGAGVTGLAAARRLAEHFPEQRIVVLEAARVGQSASGANAGFAIDLAHHQTENSDEAMREGQRITRLNCFAVDRLSELIQTHQLDCAWERRGMYQGAATDIGRRHLDEMKKVLERSGSTFETLSRNDIETTLGTRFYHEAIFTPGTHLFQPAALVRGLAGCMPSNVELFEDSPVIAADLGTVSTLECKNGSVRTPKLFLATNGFTDAFGFLPRRSFNVMLYASLTRPLMDAELIRLGHARNWGITPAHPWGATVRLTRDNRIWLRTAYGYFPRMVSSDAKMARALGRHVASFKARFPQLGEPPFQHTYASAVCLTRNGAPFFGKLADNIFAAVFTSGVGVLKGTANGHLLADWAAGAESELLTDARAYGRPNRVPPEPLLGWGVKMRMAWDLNRGRGEL